MPLTNKLLKHFAITILALLCIAGIFVFLCTTETGLQGAFYVITKFFPGEFQVENLSGKLIGPIHIDYISYHAQDQDLAAANIYFDWDVFAFFTNTLHVKKLYAQNIQVEKKQFTLPSESKDAPNYKKSSGTFTNFSLPLKLKFDEVKLRNVVLRINHTSTLINSIDFSSNITSPVLWHINVEIKAQNSYVQLKGEVAKTWQVQWDCHIRQLQQFINDASGMFASTGNITGAFNNPIITANTKIENFQYKNNAIKNLENKIAVNLASDKVSHVDFLVTKIKLFGFAVDNFVLQSSLQKDQKNQIKAQVLLPRLSVETPYSTAFKTIVLQKIAGNLVLNKEGFFSDFNILISPKISPVNVKFSLPEYKWFTAVTPKTKISGNLIFAENSLSFFNSFFPQIKNLTGMLSARLNLNGTLDSPQFQGGMLPTNIGFSIPKANITFAHSSLLLNAVHDELNYNASLSVLNGNLKILGKANFTTKGIINNTSISGTNFPVINSAEYKINISPDLQLKYSNSAFYLLGKIYIPSANIAPKKFTNVVMLPSETVYTGSKKEELSLENLPLHSNIQLIMGDNVKIDVMNISGKLTGAVNVIDEPAKITYGRGVLNIQNGTYNLYKEKLEITEGNLKFAGDIKNPELYLRSIRKFKANSMDQQEFYVGMLTRGKLDNLSTTLFSSPSTLSQTDIFSYLVLGIPSKEASQDKGQLLMKAASLLNFNGTGPVTGLMEGIQKQFGLSEFALGSETIFAKPTIITASGHSYIASSSDMTTNTALVLGKYISPRLYVGYSMGLMNQVNIFRIRYYLTRSWSVQSESSTVGNGADVLYTVER